MFELNEAFVSKVTQQRLRKYIVKIQGEQNEQLRKKGNIPAILTSIAGTSHGYTSNF